MESLLSPLLLAAIILIGAAWPPAHTSCEAAPTASEDHKCGFIMLLPGAQTLGDSFNFKSEKSDTKRKCRRCCKEAKFSYSYLSWERDRVCHCSNSFLAFFFLGAGRAEDVE